MVHKTLPMAAQTATILWGGAFGGAVYKLYRKSKRAAFMRDITYAGSYDITYAGPS